MGCRGVGLRVKDVMRFEAAEEEDDEEELRRVLPSSYVRMYSVLYDSG